MASPENGSLNGSLNSSGSPSRYPVDISTLRAGSNVGISLRAKMEWRHPAKTKNKWKDGFFTFNEITCGLTVHTAPGDPPSDIFEVAQCITKPNRMFKRKNRMDVVCVDNTVLSLSASSPDIKSQFMDKFSETLSPTNSASTRQLRADMAAESRKVIALTDLHERLKQKYEALLLQNGENVAAESEMKAKLVQEKFIKLIISHGK